MYGEQILKAIAEYESEHNRAKIVSMTPAMYNLLKKENEERFTPEPEGGWKLFYGVKIQIDDVSKEPLFCVGAVMQRPKEEVDKEKVKLAMKCHIMGEKCHADGMICPYFNEPTCLQKLFDDVTKLIEKGENA